jgi:hypothetical protein
MNKRHFDNYYQNGYDNHAVSYAHSIGGWMHHRTSLHQSHNDELADEQYSNEYSSIEEINQHLVHGELIILIPKSENAS